MDELCLEMLALKMTRRHSDIFSLIYSVMRKTTQCIAELMEQSGDKLMENALVNGGIWVYGPVTFNS